MEQTETDNISKMKNTFFIIFLFLFIACQKENTPPLCNILSPSNGSVVKRGEPLIVNIEAFDEDGIIEEEMFYGASSELSSVKESTTRQVLVYYPPTAVEKGSLGNWVIDNHPIYKSAEISIYVFLGGTPPKNS